MTAVDVTLGLAGVATGMAAVELVILPALHRARARRHRHAPGALHDGCRVIGCPVCSDAPGRRL